MPVRRVHLVGAAPAERRVATPLALELAEEPPLQLELLRGRGQREQPLGAAELVGELEQVEELGHGVGRSRRHPEHEVRPVDPVGDRILEGLEAAHRQVDLVDALEQLGQALRHRVVRLVGQREQPQLAADLPVVPPEVRDELDRHRVEHHGLVVVGDDRRAARRVVAGHVDDRGGRRLGHLLVGLEPDDLAVVADVDAPGQGAHRDQSEAPAERGEQLVLVGHPRVDGGHHPGAVGDLEPRVVEGAGNPHRHRGLAVEDGVGDELGDRQLSRLRELRATYFTAHVTGPATCLLHGSRAAVECHGWPVQRQRRALSTGVLMVRVWMSLGRDTHQRRAANTNTGVGCPDGCLDSAPCCRGERIRRTEAHG